MKLKHWTLADIALKSGIPYNQVRDLVENMSKYDHIMKLEKIMAMLEIFNFDEEDVDKAMKKQIKKSQKTKKDYIC